MYSNDLFLREKAFYAAKFKRGCAIFNLGFLKQDYVIIAYYISQYVLSLYIKDYFRHCEYLGFRNPKDIMNQRKVAVALSK